MLIFPNITNNLFSGQRALKMPSIEQCEVKSDTMAALPASLEVFDKFKPTSPEVVTSKDSDSDESFHFTLDEEEDGDHST